ncbi:hypothetical protein GGS23DRAFT_537865 [Durotheca rogersii]|uniref:uncharacterized protein n=1 Tax=Durotheca rogersii TaxID=419775 RepID=UPI00221F9279|nr:uncharacterized protein GGS23DRAFT_537865 [Durotheca rogersii]KAI5863523.1 hypothetical protein GGS23DRAFT_537865 [Durotheca rogersii]
MTAIIVVIIAIILVLLQCKKTRRGLAKRNLRASAIQCRPAEQRAPPQFNPSPRVNIDARSPTGQKHTGNTSLVTRLVGQVPTLAC